MIEQTQAIELARQHAEARNWVFAEPVAVVVRRDWSGEVSRFEIETNAGGLGAKARFVIDARSAAVLSEGFIAR